MPASLGVELTQTPTPPRFPCVKPGCGKETKEHTNGGRICSACKNVTPQGAIFDRHAN